MSGDNLKIWNAVDKPPKEALKEIRGGRLSGMTDIKPQWRYKVMTEQFGPCGIGWKYTITNKWTMAGSESQELCFVDVDLFFRLGDVWSEAIPGTGGSMLVTKEKNGLHTSDEGFKMALTDALSVAMGRIGVAAEIYMGNWTGSKYKDEQPDQQGKVVDEVKKEFPGAKVVSNGSVDEHVGLLKTFTTKSEFQDWKAETGCNLSPEIKGPIMTEYFKLSKEAK